MVITKEWINVVAPEHGRTSCSDQNLSNAYGGWSGYYDRNTGKKEIIYPRCNRCFLLDNLGIDADTLDFIVEVVVHLHYKT